MSIYVGGSPGELDIVALSCEREEAAPHIEINEPVPEAAEAAFLALTEDREQTPATSVQAPYLLVEVDQELQVLHEVRKLVLLTRSDLLLLLLKSLRLDQSPLALRFSPHVRRSIQL